MTFSVVGRSAGGGRFGVAVCSSSPAVAARCAHARPGVGAATSQNVTDPRLGPLLLDQLGAGRSGEAAVAAVTRSGTDPSGPDGRDPDLAWRQLTAIGRLGPPGWWSGARTLGRHGAEVGPDVVAAGNLLASPGVPAAAVAAFGSGGDASLAERLLAALAAGRDAGGEEGPLHSAGLLVVADVAWPVTDLRVDWTDGDPVAELADLWARWAPEEDAYRARALDPGGSPGYGVPGDDRSR